MKENMKHIPCLERRCLNDNINKKTVKRNKSNGVLHRSLNQTADNYAGRSLAVPAICLTIVASV